MREREENDGTLVDELKDHHKHIDKWGREIDRMGERGEYLQRRKTEVGHSSSLRFQKKKE